MSRVAVEIDFKQIESAIWKLDVNERWKIAKTIVKQEFQDVVDKFHKTIKKKNLTVEKIDHVVEKAREEFYAKSRGRY